MLNDSIENTNLKNIEIFEKEIEINPTDPDLWDNKGSCLEQIGKTEEALFCYEQAKDFDRF